MKVVDKIRKFERWPISSQHFTRGLFYTKMVFLYYMQIRGLVLVPVDTQKIDSVYMACIGFIIWWKDLTKR
jgi:hypothetical protein